MRLYFSPSSGLYYWWCGDQFNACGWLRDGRWCCIDNKWQNDEGVGCASKYLNGIQSDLISFAGLVLLLGTTNGEGTEDTRRRVQQTELEAIPEIDAILDHFGQARLLTFDRDPATRVPTVEVAHEASIRSWDRFKEWVNDSRDELRIQRNLTITTSEWLDSDRDSGFLARDARLEQFEAWAEQTELALTGDERDFLTQSLQVSEEREQAETLRKAHEAEIAQRAQNFQRATAGLAVVVMLAVVAILGAIQQSNEAQSQLGTATFAQGEALDAQETSVARE